MLSEMLLFVISREIQLINNNRGERGRDILYNLEALHMLPRYKPLKSGRTLFDAFDDGFVGVHFRSRPIQERTPGVSVFLVKIVRGVIGSEHSGVCETRLTFAPVSCQ
jgi:hypothetical protein